MEGVTRPKGKMPEFAKGGAAYIGRGQHLEYIIFLNVRNIHQDYGGTIQCAGCVQRPGPASGCQSKCSAGQQTTPIVVNGWFWNVTRIGCHHNRANVREYKAA